ncbi:hypothetical protein C0J52_15854 [Blattella germanica]|nr:hypothetical protein C0J52_15854 [Blattella germanica]
MIFERKVLRKIYGPVNDRGIWRIRNNNEIYNLYKEPNIIKVIKANRLRWLGHLHRSEDNNPFGRPATRWLDDVENDLRALQVRNWKIEAKDRTRWRKIIGAVLA